MGTEPERDWSGRRVTVVAAFDSFLRAARPYADWLQDRGATVDYRLLFARPQQMSRRQLRDIGVDPQAVRTVSLSQLVDPTSLAETDVVLAALDGLRSRRLAVALHRAFRERPRRPLLVSFYPGVVFRFHLEGMLSRMAADVLLLNSPSDFELYEAALEGMGFENHNAIMMGLSFLPPPSEASPARPTGGDVLFVGQPTVPAGRTERAYVLERMAGLARAHPDHRWLIKPRHRRGESTLHRMDYHYEDLFEQLQIAAPVNLSFVHEPMSHLLEQVGVCLTFSSTAAIEAVVRGVPTRVLNDVGIHENVGNHFFLGSGLLCPFDDVRPDLDHRVDEAWLTRNAVSASSRLPEVGARLIGLLEQQERLGRALPPPHASLFGRSPAFEEYVERTMGAGALADFGGRPSGAMATVNRWIRPFQSKLTGLIRR